MYGEHHPWVLSINSLLCYYLQTKIVIRYGMNHLQTIKDSLERIVKVVPCRTLIDGNIKCEMPFDVPVTIDSALLAKTPLICFQPIGFHDVLACRTITHHIVVSLAHNLPKYDFRFHSIMRLVLKTLPRP